MTNDDEVPQDPGDEQPPPTAPDPLFELFLQAYLPVLARLDAPAEGQEPVLTHPTQEDVAVAAEVAERFFTEETALRLFPAEARRILAGTDRWRWCLLYVRCCWMFGWLVCRGCRDFRAIAHYLYRYWLCVRQTVANPDRPVQLGDAERADLEVLVRALADVYSGWLEAERLNVQLHAGVTDEVLAGRVDCCRDDRFPTAVFERLFTPETAPAIMGREAWAAHQKDPFFWLCRCWCMAAVRFGCCVACARTRRQLLECFRRYVRDLEDCFRPLRCENIGPTGCVADELEAAVGGLAVPITGTVAGAFFGGYTVEWRMVEGDECLEGGGWRTDRVVYPGGGSSGTSQVFGGVIAWLDTTLLTARSYEVRVCPRTVPSSGVAPPPCCCTIFNLFKHLVWIDHVAGAPVRTPPGPFAASAEIVSHNPGGHVVPVGCCFTVRGSAWVGECNDRKIRCFDVRYGIGHLPGPDEAGFDPSAYTGSLLPAGPVCYVPPDEDAKRAPWNQVIGRALTTRLVQTQVQLFPGLPPLTVWKLEDRCFDSASRLPACPDLNHACRSGRYTFLVEVEDTQGNRYHDTQQVWIDNKPLHAELGGFEGVKDCTRMPLRQFAGDGCSVPWPLAIMGMVFDEYIEPGYFAYPSDNFDFYTLSITRGCSKGVATWQVPITPDLVNFHADLLTGAVNPLRGTARVGDPGTRCEQTAGCAGPLPLVPPRHDGVLTLVDLRAFDAACAASLPEQFRPPPGFPLKRGECCCYVIELYAQDRTWSDAGPGTCHRVRSRPCSVYICNDLAGDVLTQPEAQAEAGQQLRPAPSPAPEG